MGTTLTAVALANDGTYLLANVGDSRTYLLRDMQLRRLSRDDSLVQALIDRGALSESEARASAALRGTRSARWRRTSASAAANVPGAGR